MHALFERLTAKLDRPMQATASLYEDEQDRARHLDSIQRLSEETAWPIPVIEPLYEETLARLKTGATVQDFLPILVAKGVKSALKAIAKHH